MILTAIKSNNYDLTFRIVLDALLLLARLGYHFDRHGMEQSYFRPVAVEHLHVQLKVLPFLGVRSVQVSSGRVSLRNPKFRT